MPCAIVAVAIRAPRRLNPLARIATLVAPPPLILAYHGISAVDPRHDPSRLFVPPERFRHQVERVVARGYELVQMAEFARRLSAGESLERTCVLTFDDGPQDNYEQLHPILRALGAPATIYLCPGLLGARYPWVDPAAGIRMMTANHVRELSSDPLIEIGSHTVEHSNLGDASFDEALAEMTASKRAVEDLVQAPTVSFAYPRCMYSAACPSAAERAGYTSAVTCGGRGGWSAFELRRELIHTPDGALTFAFKELGLYHRARELAPLRLGRWITRPYRHRAERGR